ncbi:uncharacterized protein LOC144101696 [Amblyomma americanum]
MFFNGANAFGSLGPASTNLESLQLQEPCSVISMSQDALHNALAPAAQAYCPEQPAYGPTTGAQAYYPEQPAYGLAPGAQAYYPEQPAYGPAPGAQAGVPEQPAYGLAPGAQAYYPEQPAYGLAPGAQAYGPEQCAYGLAPGAQAYDPQQPAYGLAPGTQAYGPQQPAYGLAPGAQAYGLEQLPYGLAPGTQAYGPEQPACGMNIGDQMAGNMRIITSKPAGASADAEMKAKSQSRVTATMVVICCSMILFAVLAIFTALVFVVGTQSDFDDDTYATSTPRGLTTPLTDPGPVIVVPVSAPETTAGATTTASTVTTTTMPPTTRTTTTTPATTTATPTASTKSPRAAMDEQPLVCTMGSRISSARMFPPDGLCEYIFFDSVDKDNRNPLAYPHLWDSDLTIFIDAYARYSTTAFGIGFAYDKVFTLVRQLRLNTIPSLLEPFWQKNIFHFGILDTGTRNVRQVDVSIALDVLQELDKEVQGQRQLGNPSFIFLAGLITDDSWLTFYEDKFTNVYKPDLFIAQGHYFYGDNTFRNCRVMPPTVLTMPDGLNDTYQNDLTVAGSTLKKLSDKGVPIVWAISVTMKGRWTMTPPLQGLPDFLLACVQNLTATSFGSYAEICTSSSFRQRQYSQTFDAILTRHNTDNVLFAYDNEMGLCRKLCTVKSQRLSLPFGITVYDLDYEDFSNTCRVMNKFGTFSRLRAIRSVLNFFRTKFRTDKELADCFQLVT